MAIATLSFFKDIPQGTYTDRTREIRKRLKTKQKNKQLKPAIYNYYPDAPKTRKPVWNARKQLMVILGQEKCQMCVISDKRLLSFDHKNNNPQKYRKNGERDNGWELRYYATHPIFAIMELQVLCHNCNSLKQIERSQLKNREELMKNTHY